ncbi:MAG TPA: hypothetical protein VN752_05550 [Solirubrobacterales bacterium]|nr:hypothetical protein [Solirubrobacterales bacterium]
MARESTADTLLEELEELGLERAPKSKQQGLAKLVTAFLSMEPKYPEGKLSKTRERELDMERLGFCKALEKLRELIAVYGTDAIAELADVRAEEQLRPHNLAGMRNWML